MRYLVLKGAPVQRLCSDGGKMDKGETVPAVEDMAIYAEAVILRPEDNNGKWFFNMHAGLSFEIENKYVNVGKVRVVQNEGGGNKGESPEVLRGAEGK